MANVSNEFIIEINGRVVRLNKGTSKHELLLILGAPFKTEICVSPFNEKLIYKCGPRARYAVLFTKEKLVYVVKSN